MIDGHVFTAVVASPELAAQGRGPASKDIGDRPMMGWRHASLRAWAIRIQIAFGEAVEDRLETDHEAGSKAGHDPIKLLLERRARWLAQMKVTRRRGDLRMAEE